MRGINILVVEDDELTIFLLKMHLTNAGFNNIEFANSAKSALYCVDRNHLDVIIMDIDILGGIDGIDTAKAIRTKFDVPIIFHSTNDIKFINNRINNIKNSFFIEKHGVYDDLISMVKSVV